MNRYLLAVGIICCPYFRTANAQSEQSGTKSQILADKSESASEGRASAIAESEDTVKTSEGSGIRNPFTFGGLKFAARGLAGIDYGDFSARDLGLKAKHFNELWSLAAQGFAGAQLGIEGQGSSTFGMWYMSSIGSPRNARNTYQEQRSATALRDRDYEALYDEGSEGGDASRIFATEREIGIYLGDWWRFSTGIGDLSLEIDDGSGEGIVRDRGTYNLVTTGFLLGSEGWGASLDISKLYGRYYRRTAVRVVLGLGYTFCIFR